MRPLLVSPTGAVLPLDGGNGGGHQVASAAVGVRVRAVKGTAEEVDDVALEAEPYVSVDGGCDANVGVAEELNDEFDALFQEGSCD